MSAKTALCVPLPTRGQPGADWVDATTVSAMQTHWLVAPCRTADAEVVTVSAKSNASRHNLGWERGAEAGPREHSGLLLLLDARNDSAGPE